MRGIFVLIRRNLLRRFSDFKYLVFMVVPPGFYAPFSDKTDSLLAMQEQDWERFNGEQSKLNFDEGADINLADTFMVNLPEEDGAGHSTPSKNTGMSADKLTGESEPDSPEMTNSASPNTTTGNLNFGDGDGPPTPRYFDPEPGGCRAFSRASTSAKKKTTTGSVDGVDDTVGTEPSHSLEGSYFPDPFSGTGIDNFADNAGASSLDNIKMALLDRSNPSLTPQSPLMQTLNRGGAYPRFNSLHDATSSSSPGFSGTIDATGASTSTADSLARSLNFCDPFSGTILTEGQRDFTGEEVGQVANTLVDFFMLRPGVISSGLTILSAATVIWLGSRSPVFGPALRANFRTLAEYFSRLPTNVLELGVQVARLPTNFLHAPSRLGGSSQRLGTIFPQVKKFCAFFNVKMNENPASAALVITFFGWLCLNASSYLESVEFVGWIRTCLRDSIADLGTRLAQQPPYVNLGSNFDDLIEESALFNLSHFDPAVLDFFLVASQRAGTGFYLGVAVLLGSFVVHRASRFAIIDTYKEFSRYVRFLRSSAPTDLVSHRPSIVQQYADLERLARFISTNLDRWSLLNERMTREFYVALGFSILLSNVVLPALSVALEALRSTPSPSTPSPSTPSPSTPSPSTPSPSTQNKL